MSLSHAKLINNAKNLRSSSTLAEVILWQRLKNKQLSGYKFRRQVPIDKYIVDFFCYELNLVIEIDGSTHFQKDNYDEYRQKHLEQLGLIILRFGDRQVKQNLEGVILEIVDWINKKSPRPAGGVKKKGLA